MLEHYTVETVQSVDEAILALEGNLKEEGFGILWQMDIPSKLQEKGVDTYTNPYRILEVCNPREAARVLNHNELAGYFLPCKITVYKSAGITKLGLIKPTAFMSMLDDAELTTVAQEIEAVLIRVLDQSK
ncbi:DUF302 domain-containing protein [Paenibacillus mendelii]|uniref:DUF302 domain-containing protein n=1 Tax=Paenibacillus mendelii TaxID=206163 RepID=A0ABV6JGF1_9BACL|nr:DUF302 domain-containing protein [Paenibacillus mendelii]MCQ6557760.1 DUF302 domain-containing protein [Paenibacillus mendelii]